MSTHKPSTTSPSLSNSTSEPAEHTHSTVNELAQSLNKIISEGRNPDSLNIDTLSTVGILRCINNEDAKVAQAVAQEIPHIAKAVDAATISIKSGGRLIYMRRHERAVRHIRCGRV